MGSDHFPSIDEDRRLIIEYAIKLQEMRKEMMGPITFDPPSDHPTRNLMNEACGAIHPLRRFFSGVSGVKIEVTCQKDKGHPGKWHKMHIFMNNENIRYSWKVK